ncbi:MAG: DUF92 domain-containing protein [Chloroflexi bacterium]|nr:DUF92 domain-containing protein [Chloroflexota bacterium]
MLLNLIYAILISGVIVGLAWRRGSLSRSGAAAAMIVGALIFGLGGWQWGILLGIFFVSSSLLSHFREAEKQAAAEKFDKGHKRDAGQVAANGGLGAALAVFSAMWPAVGWFPLFVGVMATVTADTWATELGALSRKPPRLIINGRIVEVGTSGGVSWLGTAVSLVGGLFIGLAAGLMMDGYGVRATALLGAAGGLAGSLFDSLLGATVQRIYYCDACQKDTERQLHKCGQATRPLRGWAWLNNDLVNLLASLVGGLVSIALWFSLS